MIQIAGLVRTSTVDYPGLLSAVLFTAGCDFDCYYCQNRSLLQPSSHLLDVQEVLAFLDKRCGLLDGIVVSGGEPLLQPDLPVFLKTIKSMGYRVKLDTNGARPEQLRRVLQAGLLDRVAIDYKAPWSRYIEICRCGPADVSAVQASFKLLAAQRISWEARTTVVPQLTLRDLRQMARSLPILPAWHLQLYRQPELIRPVDRQLCAASPYTATDLRRMAAALAELQPVVSARC